MPTGNGVILAKGINVMDGKVTYKAVALAHGYTYTSIDTGLKETVGTN